MKESRESVLIVEDDEGVAVLERRALERRGFQVDVATNLADALAAVSSSAYDLIVTDYRLQNDTGLELLARIHALGRGTPPVIVVTGFSDEATVIEAIRCGARDFVPKSAEYLHYLPDAVERVLKAVRTEKELARSEAQFQLFMDNSPAVAFIKDEAGRLVYANRATQKLLRRSDWQGKSDFELWPLETAQQLRENDLAALRGENVKHSRESISLPDGSLRHFDSYKFAMRDATGRQFIGGMAVDVTQQLIAEQAVQERDKQLRQSQKLEAVGTLAGGVAHEFNNLLQAVLGYTRFAMTAIGADHRAQDDLEVVVAAAERAAHLTQQLLSFSRRESGELAPLDVSAAIRETTTMLRPLLGEQVTIELALQDDLPPILADASQIQQLLMNLCINARDAMPTGGAITITTCEHAVAARHYVRICVADDGCGMSEEVKQKIFEPFFTTKPVGKGTGLGLAMVYGVVKNHQGNIRVDSQPGRGTRFTIDLPQTSYSPDPATPLSHAAIVPGSETILVAEDEPLVLDLTRRTLEGHGYRVLAATDGREALRMFQEHQAAVDLVILDAVMPQLSGWEALRSIRDLNPSVPAIFCTGYDRERTSDSPIGPKPHFIQKPFPLEQLLTVVREVLQESCACQLV